MPVNLQVKYFETGDLAVLNDWLKARDKNTVESVEVPAVGFLVSYEDMPIAACFLRRCEGGVGIVEGLTTNPEAASELRHFAIDAAINCIIEEARAREMIRLMAWSIDNGTLVRGLERHGFVQTHQTLITKPLEATRTH